MHSLRATKADLDLHLLPEHLHLIYKDSCQPASALSWLWVPSPDPALKTCPHQHRPCGFPCCGHRLSQEGLWQFNAVILSPGHSDILAFFLVWCISFWYGRKLSFQLFLSPSNKGNRYCPLASAPPVTPAMPTPPPTGKQGACVSEMGWMKVRKVCWTNFLVIKKSVFRFCYESSWYRTALQNGLTKMTFSKILFHPKDQKK